MTAIIKKIAVVIPCYKVKKHIAAVLGSIGAEVSAIYVIDDACPENTGEFVASFCRDSRVVVIRNTKNMGVGGAVIEGYLRAIKDGMAVIVKIDGDGQMDASVLSRFVRPIIEGRADYVKGNRFYDPRMLIEMPVIRLLGNAVLSFVNKIVSGFWDVMDPTNGYVAISVQVLKLLPLEKLDKRYFFESDMLFRLGTVGAVVLDMPMKARYGTEKSNLSIINVATRFPAKYFVRFFKRVFYRYFLRDFNLGSLSLITGCSTLTFGALYGGWMWYLSIITGVPATSGTVMLAAFPAFLGLQLLLFFLNYDISNVPRVALSQYLD